MIRRATLADLENIAVIYNEVILEGGFTGDLQPLSVESRRAWFFDHQDRYSIFVKSMGNSLVGYAALSPYRNGRNAFNETCEISYYLASQHRGLGLGKELVGHAIERAEHLGFRLIVAMIWNAINEASTCFWNLASQFQAGCPRRRRSTESISIMSSFLAARRPIKTVT